MLVSTYHEHMAKPAAELSPVEEKRREIVETVEKDVKELEEVVEQESLKSVQRVRAHTIEFMDFIREKGVVGLAVGIIIGAAVTTLVQSLVNDIINPLIGLVLPNADSLSNSTLSLSRATIGWGAFVAALINFFIIALVIFFAFKFLKLDKLDKSKL